MSSGAQTLFGKIWSRHVIEPGPAGHDLLYVDLHLVQEVSSHRAFQLLDEAGLRVRRPDRTLAMADHSVPTLPWSQANPGEVARTYLEAASANTARHGITYLPYGDRRQGIVHVVGPELGATLPGMTVVCGDSHTSTYGALGALGFGIGSTQVAHVLASQTLLVKRPLTLRVTVDGALPESAASKDIALAMTSRFGNLAALGQTIEYAGPAIEALSVEARMTLCNMGIELGARSAVIAPDDVAFSYLEGRPYAPEGHAWEKALDEWRSLRTDDGAIFDRELRLDAREAVPHATWGTTPAQAVPIAGVVPDPGEFAEAEIRERAVRALAYMRLQPGTPMQEIAINAAFIGSCTNARIEDLRSAAAALRGRRVADGVTAIVSPGSASVKRQAEEEGLDRIFAASGFEWRNSACSFCVAANGDRLPSGTRCASSTNRNFENRQGPGVMTHIMSPASVAASAVSGRICSADSIPGPPRTMGGPQCCR